jgi:diguanylate cyclase (GGDEF)-like protein
MDYGTYFFTNIVLVGIFTVCIILLAWYNRQVEGMKWFAGGMILGLVKLILQGLEGKVHPALSSMLASELYLVSFLMQWMGLRWFVVRKPMLRRWPWMAIGLVLAVYTGLYIARIPYGANVINIPFVVVCGVSAWTLLKNGRQPFLVVSRVAAGVLFGAMGVATYRAALTNLRYIRPWETVHAQTDPRWLYSLAAMAFFATCMVMCDLWFLVTELSRELAEQARTDSLTGALNRRAMEEAALREMARSARYGYQLSMIMIDIDNFKHLNDSRGHAAGDCALQAFSRVVKAMLRGPDLLARTGGDEFTILLPDTPASAGIAAAERIRRAVESLEIGYGGEPIKFTVSAGVAQLDPAHGGWEGMLQRADEAMYAAKRSGRNSVATRLLEAVT